MLAGQLRETAHFRVVGRQILGEGDQAVGAQLDGVRSQDGRHRGQVAQRDRADDRLRDGLQALGEAGLAGPGLARWLLADPQFVAGLVQAEQAGGVVGPGVVARAGGLGEGVGEGVEVVVGELIEGLARAQAEQAEPAAGDVAGPGAAPAEPFGDLCDAGDVVGVARRPLLVEVAGVLGEQEVEVGSQVAFDETPGEERPCSGAGEVGEPGGSGPGHPLGGPRVDRQQPGRRVASQPLRVRPDRQVCDRVGVGDQQAGCVASA